MITWTQLQEASTLDPSTLLEFYILDLSVLGGPQIFFHSNNYDDLAWQGYVYVPFPVQAAGFEYNATGTQPRPKLSFGNASSAFSDLCRNYGDLVGAKITRKRTFLKFLDGQPGQDENAHFPDEIWYVIQKTSETNVEVTFEVGTMMDVEAVMIPRRVVLADVCSFLYRGDGCFFNMNKAIATVDDASIMYGIPQVYRGPWSGGVAYNYANVVYIATPQRLVYYFCNYPNASLYPPTYDGSYWLADECSKTLNGCKMRFQNPAFALNRAQGLPFGGFPGVQKVPLTGG
jgi:lambda family phage minor tail protein L